MSHLTEETAMSHLTEETCAKISTAPLCVLCGVQGERTPDGRRRQYITGRLFGLDGTLCSRCYERLYRRHRRRQTTTSEYVDMLTRMIRALPKREFADGKVGLDCFRDLKLELRMAERAAARRAKESGQSNEEISEQMGTSPQYVSKLLRLHNGAAQRAGHEAACQATLPQ